MSIIEHGVIVLNYLFYKWIPGILEVISVTLNLRNKIVMIWSIILISELMKKMKKKKKS